MATVTFLFTIRVLLGLAQGSSSGEVVDQSIFMLQMSHTNSEGEDVPSQEGTPTSQVTQRRISQFPKPEDAPFQGEAKAAYDSNLTQKWTEKLPDDHGYIANSVTINRPIQEVFDAITTSYMWVVCYPETVGVGGIARRPFKKDDIVLEKFMFAGQDYTLIRYQIDVLQRPSKALFHGDRILVADTPANNMAAAYARKIGGSFEYDFEAVSPDKTKWTRKVHFYHTFDKDDVQGRGAFHVKMQQYLKSQQYGAALYVECVKRFMETEGYKTELFL